MGPFNIQCVVFFYLCAALVLHLLYIKDKFLFLSYTAWRYHLFFCLNRCRYLTYTHKPFFARLLLLLRVPCGQLHQQPQTVVMVWNIPVTPVGLTSPLRLHVTSEASGFPASCFPQVLSADRGYEGRRRRQRNKHRQTSSYRMEHGSLGAYRSLWWCVFSAGLLKNTTCPLLTSFAVSYVTNCLATTPGVISVTQRGTGCTQTLAKKAI